MSDAVAFVELWSAIKSYIPVKDQKACAEQYISSIDDSGLVDVSSSLNEMYGVCEEFDKALKNYARELELDTYNDLEEW